MISKPIIPFLCSLISVALISGCNTAPNNRSAMSQQQRVIVASGSQSVPKTNYATIDNRTVQGDSIGNLIRNSDQAYPNGSVIIKETTEIHPNHNNDYNYTPSDSWQFNDWLNRSSYRMNEVGQYQSYLVSYLGENKVPPMQQLLTSARSWDRCGYEPFQLPPRELWANIVGTLEVYNTLKMKGLIPQTSEIRSVYRSPALNACAGGSSGSKHMSNSAIDIWVPEYDGQSWYINPMQDRLCKFWFNEGMNYNLGMGVYQSGAIHLDTQGFRLWGERYTAPGSYCRYLN